MNGIDVLQMDFLQRDHALTIACYSVQKHEQAREATMFATYLSVDHHSIHITLTLPVFFPEL